MALIPLSASGDTTVLQNVMLTVSEKAVAGSFCTNVCFCIFGHTLNRCSCGKSVTLKDTRLLCFTVHFFSIMTDVLLNVSGTRVDFYIFIVIFIVFIAFH